MSSVSNNLHRIAGVLGTLAIALSAIGSTAKAGSISYALTICEDLNVLKNPTNPNVLKTAAWQSQHTLMLARTNPYLELKNTSDPSGGAQITTFNMTIGNTADNFDWATMIQASPGVTVTVNSPDSIKGGAKSDVLNLSFTGLDPGDFVRFRTGLSPDNPNGLPILDFRQIFFHMNDMNLPGSNSVTSITFQSSLGTDTLTQTLPNFAVGDGDETATSLVPADLYGEDMVIPFTTTGQGNQTPVVPEPGSFVILAAGLMGLAGFRLTRLRGKGRPALPPR